MLNALRVLFGSRHLVLTLSRSSFQRRYLGSYLGGVWAFVQPVVSILVYWFVFQVGFRSHPVGHVPYIIWLMAGMVPWFFISDAITSSSNAVIENDFLVKKIPFRVSLLPVANVISSLVVHLAFVCILLVISCLYRNYPNLYTFQLIYYVFAEVALVIGMGWLFSALVVVFRDVTQIINICLQFGIWITPIFWKASMVRDKLAVVLKLNPFFYIVQGYRDSLFGHEWFWTHYRWTLWYWVLTLTVLTFGVFLFKRVRPDFADYL